MTTVEQQQHEIRIDSPGPRGMGTTTTIDGQPILSVTDLDIHIGTVDPTVVTVRTIAYAAHFEGQAEVRWRVGLVGDEVCPEGTGPTLAIALHALAAHAEQSGL